MITIILTCIMTRHLSEMFVWIFTTTSLSITEILLFIKKMVENCRGQHCQLTHA